MADHGRVPQSAGRAGPEHHGRGPGAAQVCVSRGHPQRRGGRHRHRPPLVRLPGAPQQAGPRQPVVHRAHLRDLAPAGPADQGGAVPHAGAQDLRGGRGGHQAHPHPQRQEVQGHHPAALGGGDHQTGPPPEKGLSGRRSPPPPQSPLPNFHPWGRGLNPPPKWGRGELGGGEEIPMGPPPRKGLELGGRDGDPPQCG